MLLRLLLGATVVALLTTSGPAPATAAPPATPPATPDITGTWQGALQVPGGTLRLLVKIRAAGGGAVTEYAQIEETMAPAALQAIGDWIAGRTAARR